jgi:hypothetical protein
MMIKVFKVGELNNPMNLFGLCSWHGYSNCPRVTLNQLGDK